MYVGIDKRGRQYALPVQAKGGKDRLAVVQTIQDIRCCKEKFPGLICRPISTQFSLISLHIRLNVELELLANFRKPLDLEQAALTALAQTIDAERSEVAFLRAMLIKASLRISEMTTQLETMENGVERTGALRARADDQRERLRADLQAVQLGCAGKSYTTCSDIRAKDDYDRRRYEGFEEWARANHSRFEIRNEHFEGRARLRNLRAQLATLQADTIRTESAKAQIELTLLTHEVEFAKRYAAFAAEFSRYREALLGSLQQGSDVISTIWLMERQP